MIGRLSHYKTPNVTYFYLGDIPSGCYFRYNKKNYKRINEEEAMSADPSMEEIEFLEIDEENSRDVVAVGKFDGIIFTGEIQHAKQAREMDLADPDDDGLYGGDGIDFELRFEGDDIRSYK